MIEVLPEYDSYMDLAEWFVDNVRDRTEALWDELLFMAVHLTAEHVEVAGS